MLLDRCTVYRDSEKNSLAHQAHVGMIVGRSDDTKGFRVDIRKDNVVTVTQKNMSRIFKRFLMQNEQLKT